MFRFFNFEIERVYYVLNNGFIFEVIVFDEDELDGSVILLLGVIVLIIGVIVLILGIIRLFSVIELILGIIEILGVIELLGVIVLILGDIVLIGVILLKSVIVLLEEFIEDFREMLSSGNFFKEGKIEEIFLFLNLYKRVFERKKRRCEDLLEEVEGVILNFL